MHTTKLTHGVHWSLALILALAGPVLNHRLVLNYQARLEGVTAPALVAELLDSVEEAGLNLPRGVEVRR